MTACRAFSYSTGRGIPPKEFNICGASERDHIFRRIKKTDTFYEIDLLEYMRFILGGKGESLCVDVGANIGNHSIYFGEYLASSVLSVEANEKIVPILRRNLEANITNYHIYGFALGASEGVGQVRIPTGSEDNVGQAVVDFVEADQPGDNLVSVKTLDQLVSEHLGTLQKPVGVGFIKIDVEGAELAVLAGAQETLLKFHPDLFLEAADADFRSQIELLLTPLGYRRISRWAGTPVYHYAWRPTLSLYVKARLYRVGYRLKRLLRRKR